jgi:aspartyl protease family protein
VRHSTSIGRGVLSTGPFVMLVGGSATAPLRRGRATTRSPAKWGLRVAAVAACCFLSCCSGPGKSPQDAKSASTDAAPNARSRTQIREQVKLERDHGTLRVPVLINGAVRLKFTIDSGASDVVIPADVAMYLVRSGTITRDDYIGDRTFVLGDGSEVRSHVFRIRSLKVGNLEMRNVEASLTNQRGTLLLGQSFLSRLSSWSIDNQRQTLLISAPTGARPGHRHPWSHTSGPTRPRAGTARWPRTRRRRRHRLFRTPAARTCAPGVHHIE